MPKIFGKYILLFILKNRQAVFRVLEKLGIAEEEDEFILSVEHRL